MPMYWHIAKLYVYVALDCINLKRTAGGGLIRLAVVLLPVEDGGDGLPAEWAGRVDNSVGPVLDAFNTEDVPAQSHTGSVFKGGLADGAGPLPRGDLWQYPGQLAHGWMSDI